MLTNWVNTFQVNVKKIVSGGAVGIDKCAEEYARIKGIELVEFLPDYKKYGKVAPILNELEEQISEIVIMPYHNKIKINICLPYFADNESPFIKAWKRIKSECEKNNIDISEGFERGIELK